MKNVEGKKERQLKQCEICGVWVKGNVISNHRKKHEIPMIKCSMCDFVGYYPYQVNYHYARKHDYKVKQGRPVGYVKRGNSQPRFFTKKVLVGLKNRKIFVHGVKLISNKEIKSRLANNLNSVETLFATPSKCCLGRKLLENYQRNLVSRSTGLEDFTMLGSTNELGLNYFQEHPDRSERIVGTILATKATKKYIPEQSKHTEKVKNQLLGQCHIF